MKEKALSCAGLCDLQLRFSPAWLRNFVVACGLAHSMAAYGGLRRRHWGLLTMPWSFPVWTFSVLLCPSFVMPLPVCASACFIYTVISIINTFSTYKLKLFFGVVMLFRLTFGRPVYQQQCQYTVSRFSLRLASRTDCKPAITDSKPRLWGLIVSSLSYLSATELLWEFGAKCHTQGSFISP